MQRASSLVFALIAVSACAQNLGTLGSLSLSLPSAASTPPTGPRIHGKSCGSSLFGLPLGAPSLESAARAAQRANGDASATLTDVRVSRTTWSIGMYSNECLIVDARATAAR
jgi:hypothetical protein